MKGACEWLRTPELVNQPQGLEAAQLTMPQSLLLRANQMVK
jgi:hypothetical protein